MFIESLVTKICRF